MNGNIFGESHLSLWNKKVLFRSHQSRFKLTNYSLTLLLFFFALRETKLNFRKSFKLCTGAAKNWNRPTGYWKIRNKESRQALLEFNIPLPPGLSHWMKVPAVKRRCGVVTRWSGHSQLDFSFHLSPAQVTPPTQRASQMQAFQPQQHQSSTTLLDAAIWLPIKTSADSSLLSALLLSGVISQQSNRNYKMILSCRKLPK